MNLNKTKCECITRLIKQLTHSSLVSKVTLDRKHHKMLRLLIISALVSAAFALEKLKCHQCNSQLNAACSSTESVRGNAFLKECGPYEETTNLTLKAFAEGRCDLNETLESCQYRWSKEVPYKVDFIDAFNGICNSSDSVAVCGEKAVDVTTFKFTYQPVYCRKQFSSCEFCTLCGDII